LYTVLYLTAKALPQINILIAETIIVFDEDLVLVGHSALLTVLDVVLLVGVFDDLLYSLQDEVPILALQILLILALTQVLLEGGRRMLPKLLIHIPIERESFGLRPTFSIL